jgi:hypothetical protein
LNKDIPLVVFHDWGNGMPFLSEIGEQDRILWLKVFAPEVFATGAVFAWPVSGGGVNYRPTTTLKDSISRLSGWYSQNRSLYINATWNPQQGANMKGQTKLVHTILDLYGTTGDTLRKMIHLINKNLDAARNLVVRKNFSVRVFSHKNPRSVWAVSPDFQDARPLNYTKVNDSVDITVNSLEAYTLVVLDYAKKVPQTIHFNSIQPHEAGYPDFAPGATASSGLVVTYSSDNANIASIVNGKVHIVGAGTCHIIAAQSGNAVYEAATNVSQLLTVNVVAIKDEKSYLPFRLYPNPCYGTVKISREGKWPVHVVIFNISGQKQTDEMLEFNELNVQQLSPGIYIVNIDGSSSYLIKR